MGRPVGSGREAPGTDSDGGLTTVRLTVEYDGTAFFGLQFQPSVRTVAGILEKALSAIFDEPIKLSAAGRTDTGVHASGQVVSFTTARSSFPFDRLVLALNSALPHDVTATEASVMPASFSARFSAVRRSYVYAIFNRPAASALYARYAYHVWLPIDLDAVGDAAARLLGTHDFRSFCATLPDNGNTVRTVDTLTVRRSGDLIRLGIGADGFLHRMVRNVVGTLVQCGTGRRDPASLTHVLAAKDRATAGPTAPAHGLYLAGVRYRDGYDSYAEPPIFQG